MLEEFNEQRRKRESNMRSFMDFTMGTIILLIGVFFLVYEYFGIKILDKEPGAIDKIIGALFVLYGGWRIYRGYKKNYFK
jgi:steroid 5-alpha reductase family enzyme